MTTRYVIVGNGAAGATAAQTIREQDANVSERNRTMMMGHGRR